jgi:hypothetical protein
LLVALCFASNISRLFSFATADYTTSDSEASFTLSASSATSSATSEYETDSISEENHSNTYSSMDPKEYPFLTHLRINLADAATQTRLVREIFKFNGGSSVKYTQISQHKG